MWKKIIEYKLLITALLLLAIPIAFAGIQQETGIYVFDGIGWDRAREWASNSFSLPSPTTGGVLATVPYYVRADDASSLEVPKAVLLGSNFPSLDYYPAEISVLYANDTISGNYSKVTAKGFNTTKAIDVIPTTTSNGYTRITINTDTAISNLVVNKIIVEAAGAGSTVALYDDSTSPCDTGLVTTLPTTTAGTIYTIEYKATNGVCLKTAGTAAATVVALTRS